MYGNRLKSVGQFTQYTQVKTYYQNNCVYLLELGQVRL